MSATRKMNVIDATEVHTGTSDSGVDWSLYEITATTPEGEPIDLKLKSFDHLDGEVEVEVERQEHEKYGVSYMLRLPRGASTGTSSPGARLGPKVDELRDRLDHVEASVTALTDKVIGLEKLAYERTGVGPAPDTKYEPIGGSDVPDDDVPF